MIRIKSKKFSDHSTKIELDGKNYYFLTELSSEEPAILKTSIYLDGAHLESIRTTLPLKGKSEVEKVMDNQHKRAIEKIKERVSVNKKKVSYFREIKNMITKNELSGALKITRKALSEFPEDQYLFSYYGYLLAAAEGNHQEGIEVCHEALRKIEQSTPFGADYLNSFLYLNLGRSYISAGLKKEAIENFRKGLSFDNDNQEIVTELNRLGIRRRPVIPFLPRRNPINKYLGLLFYRC